MRQGPPLQFGDGVGQRGAHSGARAAGYSRYHFARAFRAAYGETPARYLSRRRIERAQELLRSVNLTVTEVCLRFDLTMENGYRWLTVGPPGDPVFQLNLTVPGPPMHDEETAAALKAMIAKGVLSGGAWHTDDCRRTYREYSARGVEFLQEPQDRPYGVEAVFRDNSGNWYSLNQLSPDAFDREAIPRKFAADGSA